ncbi:ABC transporter permease [Rhodoferax sp. PAMC 29310]|uniref:ABC transporter permease n=1 Tax=Rhodoferax sp. PAMC 29310 TaxID=2822760 RepID=UPI001F0AF9A0|nr:ABC transporter permease [Rhodoferax sp. PAMC 29310]
MSTTPVRRTDLRVALVLLVALAVPLLWSILAALRGAFDLTAWHDLWADTQTWPAVYLTLVTGLLASGLAMALAAWLLSHHFPGRHWARLVRALGPLLAVPHAAFAIGLAFLIAPSGWFLRALSPWASGLDAPPPWPTTQDPWGLGLVMVLVAKEVPFLLWAAATQLQRADVAHTWMRELQAARSMGYSPRTAWWRVLWPQLWPRLRWPMLAVLAYNLTVVDMALVIGPTSPPTLAVLAWQWLLDADVARNAQGTAAAWLLAALVVSLTLLLWPLPRLAHWRNRCTNGARGASPPTRGSMGRFAWGGVLGLYLAVMLALAVGSVSGFWPFPALLPETWTWRAWNSVWNSLDTVGTTLTLAMASAVTALAWSVAWLECAPPRWIEPMRRVIYLPLILPPVLWVVGVHGLTLTWGLDATWTGVWLAHTLAALPYVLIALSPAYTGFDPRFRQLCASLGQGRWTFLWRVKWPLLRASLTAAFAIGFSVSVAQYLPTLFVGAGRFGTVTTEAITLAAGAQRSLTASYAWLQWILPVLVFGLAAWLGQARRFRQPPTPRTLDV